LNMGGRVRVFGIATQYVIESSGFGSHLR